MAHNAPRRPASAAPLNFDVVMSPMPHIRQGKLKPLLVTSARRYAALPDTQTVIEAGVPDLEMTAWFGFVAPARTPPDIVSSLNAAIVRALRLPEVGAALEKQGMQVVTSTPGEFRAFVARSLQRVGSAVATAKIPKTD